MNLFEYEGKQLLRQYGMAVPESRLLTDGRQAPPLAFPFVLKAQVLTGGRGKAGGIKSCQNEAEYRENAAAILPMRIKGRPVHALLAEQMVRPEQEYYLSITLQGVEKPTLIFSRMGGMDIESVAAEHPEEIHRVEIDPFTRLKDYQLRYLTGLMDKADPKQARQFLQRLQTAFFESCALLAEINPLGVAGGGLVAMDAKFVIDDHAKAARETLQKLADARESLRGYRAPEAEKTTVTYVPLQGNIGLISDGAGTGMLTLDLLTDLGGKVACFTELGGMTTEEVMYRAMELTLDGHPEIECLMIVLIGGFNRMDNMAKGITGYVREHGVKIPIFTRMCGTMEEEGIRLMRQAGMETWYDLTEAADALIRTAGGA